MKLFRRYRRRLAKELPPCLPTRVYVCSRKAIIGKKDAHCITNKDQTGWIIRIADDLNEQTACDCLHHEWAHAVADIRKEPHDDRWGVAASRAWRILDAML